MDPPKTFLPSSAAGGPPLEGGEAGKGIMGTAPMQRRDGRSSRPAAAAWRGFPSAPTLPARVVAAPASTCSRASAACRATRAPPPPAPALKSKCLMHRPGLRWWEPRAALQPQARKLPTADLVPSRCAPLCGSGAASRRDSGADQQLAAKRLRKLDAPRQRRREMRPAQRVRATLGRRLAEPRGVATSDHPQPRV